MLIFKVLRYYCDRSHKEQINVSQCSYIKCSDLNAQIYMLRFKLKKKTFVNLSWAQNQTGLDPVCASLPAIKLLQIKLSYFCSSTPSVALHKFKWNVIRSGVNAVEDAQQRIKSFAQSKYWTQFMNIIPHLYSPGIWISLRQCHNTGW